MNEIKKIVKQNDMLKAIYFIGIKSLFMLDPIIPTEVVLKFNYWIIMGKKLDLKNPKGLNEKLQWLKLYYRSDLLIKCTDKYLVRDYVINKGHSAILNDLIAVYEKDGDIDFGQLPEKFALKATHGCATNLICVNKANLDIKSSKMKIKQWLKQKTGLATGEFHYKYITPRIIVEKYIGSEKGELPLDYKIFCFNGKPYCICVYSDRRITDNSTKRCYFDFEWNHLDIADENYYTDPSQFPKPKNLELMKEVASDLSEDFPFVRVDLYEVDGKIIFGELTFTPTGGYGKAFNTETDILFGSMLSLPTNKISRYNTGA